MTPPWFYPKECPPDLELGLQDLPRTSTAASDRGITPPLGLSEPMPEWLDRKPISDAELDRWAAAHLPKTGSGNQADTIHGKLSPDGSKREDSTEYRMSGGL